MDTHRLAWLAGLMDGEGSIGIARESKPARTEGHQNVLRPSVQMSMTCKVTIDAALSVLTDCGVKGAAYTYQERDPSKHQDAWFIRVPRLVDIATLAPLMLPYAITKRRQWVLILEFATSRLALASIRADGRVDRGGFRARPYTDRELAIAVELRSLNLRGKAAVERNANGSQG